MKDEDNVGTINPFRYRGYYYDIETQLYYLKTRYYDPETGRFVNADSVSVLEVSQTHINGLNLYAYCVNNPVMYVDPSGRIFDWFNRNIIQPIGNFVNDVIVQPVVNTLSSAANWVNDNIFQPIGNAVNSVVGWVQDNFITILTVVAVVALSVALPGVGTMLGGMLIGAALGAGMSIIQQGLENGWDNINWLDVGISALIGGAAGAFTGGAGGAMVGRIGGTAAGKAIGSAAARAGAAAASAGRAMASAARSVVSAGTRAERAAASTTTTVTGRTGASAYTATSGKATTSATSTSSRAAPPTGRSANETRKSAEIIGKAHGSPEHVAMINQITAKMAKGGKYSKIYLNRSLHTTGVKAGSYLRPDIIGVKRGGFTLIEVASKSQVAGRGLTALENNVAFYKEISNVVVRFIKWGY